MMLQLLPAVIASELPQIHSATSLHWVHSYRDKNPGTPVKTHLPGPPESLGGGPGNLSSTR